MESSLTRQEPDFGGTGAAAHENAKAAYKSVTPNRKRSAFIMLGAAGVTLAFLLLTRLIGLIEKANIDGGGTNISRLVYYIILSVVSIIFVVVLNEFLKHTCSYHHFAIRKCNISIPRALAIIAIGAATVLAVSASIGFKLKIEREMGMGVTMATALVNIAIYVYYCMHLWLGMIAASLVQCAMSTLFPAKYTVPYGAIFLVAVYGTLEFLFESFTTTHMFPELYFFMTFAYAAIFVLTGRKFHFSYWASAVVLFL